MPSKIKVLQVIPKLGYGGAETGCYDLAHYLNEKDFDAVGILTAKALKEFSQEVLKNIIKHCDSIYQPNNNNQDFF